MLYTVILLLLLNSDMKRNQKKDYAKILFLREDITQKEIAERVGVAEKTLSNWIKKENWNKLKASIIITKEEQLIGLYNQVLELNNMIKQREEGKRYPTKSEADTLAVLMNSIKNFEGEANLSDVIAVFRRFLNWLRPINLEKAKEIVELQDEFIKSIMHE